MELAHQDYPAILPSLQPGVAVRLLHERLKTIDKLNTDIADWLQERRRIEESYAQGLRKLAARQLLEDGGELGILTTPWQKIASSVHALAESHIALANNIGNDVERPLREFSASSREMQALSTIYGNLQSIARDVETAQKKADKLLGRGGKGTAEKVANASSEVESAQNQWQSQAPYVFERLQEVDEIRMEQLRSGLTQYQTHIIEATSAPTSSAEDCLNALLNMQTIDEIKTFAARSTTMAGSTGSRTALPLRADPVANLEDPSHLTPNASQTLPEDRRSQRSGSVKEKPKGALSGLKRLGTVIGRRRQSVHPYGQPAIAETKNSSSNLSPSFTPFKKKSRELSNRPHSSDSRRLSESGSHNANPPLETVAANHTEQSKVDTVDNLVNDRQVQPAPVNDEASPVIPASNTNDLLSHEIPSGSFLAGDAIQEPSVDDSGYSAPSEAVDALTQAEREAAMTNDASQQFKVDIRNAPIAEEDDDASAAMANVASALRAQAAPRRTVGTVRGRRDRNTVLMTNPQEDFLANATPESTPVAVSASSPTTSTNPTSPVEQPRMTPPILQSPLKQAQRPPPSTDDAAGSDTHSIRSGRSLSSTASSVIKHPDMHEPGLNSSIVETVSAWFSDNSIKRALVVGEVALAYNPIDFSAPFGTDLIRLDNFSALEKVAPNPAFVEAVKDQPGSYNITLRDVTKTAIAFKYQMHLDESDYVSHTPLMLKTTWKIEATQSSVVLAYGLHPGFAQSLPASVNAISLSNVVLILHMDPSGAKATACKAMSGGVFSKERNLVYWRLGDVKLSRESPAATLRARFFVEGEVRAGFAEARWEMTSDHVVDVGTGLDVSVLEQGGTSESDPFADDTAGPILSNTWRKTKSIKRFRSGTYQST